MRTLLALMGLFTLLQGYAVAQGRYDANWVFGTKCGLRFNEDSTLSTFQTLSNNLEATTSISDSVGSLLLYTSGIGKVPRSFYTIYNANNQVIANGDSINGASTVTNGMQFVWQSKHRILLIQLVNDEPESCSSARCIFPQYSLIELNDLGEWEVVKKNVVLPDSQVHEKLVTIKHANGRDTWLLLRETSSQSRGCSNRYYKYLITEDTVYKYGNQDIGYVSCHDFNLFGELFSNVLGDRIVAIYPEAKVIDLLGFNRCNGELQNLNQLSIADFSPYSGSFSMGGSFLYIAGAASVAGVGGVLQYKLDSNGQVTNKDTIHKVTN